MCTIKGLVHTLAKSRLKKEEMLEGRGGRRSRMTGEAALALLTGQIRRSLSLVAARATAKCLLDRLEALEGAGGKGTGERAACSRPQHEAWKGSLQKRRVLPRLIPQSSYFLQSNNLVM